MRKTSPARTLSDPLTLVAPPFPFRGGWECLTFNHHPAHKSCGAHTPVRVFDCVGRTLFPGSFKWSSDSVLHYLCLSRFFATGCEQAQMNFKRTDPRTVLPAHPSPKSGEKVGQPRFDQWIERMVQQPPVVPTFRRRERWGSRFRDG